jgi:hypothetical protein
LSNCGTERIWLLDFVWIHTFARCALTPVPDWSVRPLSAVARNPTDIVPASGVLTDAMSNYVLSNTTQVFQINHQAKRIRDNLLHLALGLITERIVGFLDELCNMSIISKEEEPSNNAAAAVGRHY